MSETKNCVWEIRTLEKKRPLAHIETTNFNVSNTAHMDQCEDFVWCLYTESNKHFT